MAAGVGDPERWTEHKFGLSDSQWVRLCGRVVVVTGAGTGLGQALAIALATAHARVVLCGRRRDRLDETLVTMRRLGSDVTDCVCLPLDVRISSAVEHAIDRINSSCGAIYGLVNNAALPPPNAGRWPLADANPADWQSQLDTNVTGSWLI